MSEPAAHRDTEQLRCELEADAAAWRQRTDQDRVNVGLLDKGPPFPGPVNSSEKLSPWLNRNTVSTVPSCVNPKPRT